MSVEPGSVVVVLTTAPTVDKASDIARALVGEKLAACVNIVPGVRSVYAWKGEICDEGEVLCLMKTRSDRVEALRDRLSALHPYEVPELLVLDVTGGLEPYLSWVRAATSGP